MKRRFMYSLFSCFFFLGSLSQAFCQNEEILEKTSDDFTSVAKHAIPAVVSIQVKSKSNNSFYEYDPSNELFRDEFFGRFFGFPKKDKFSNQQQVTQASGFIVTPDGYILTNNHVVSEPGIINVRLNDGRQFTGKVIGKDDSTDLALIKVDAQNLPFLKLGNSDKLEVGQWVVAIGNPLGLQASLTVGVVSAKGRNNLELARFEDFIQTDAALNRGNSGGPLLNLKGDVIGMNTAIATNYASGYMGIGFAIPSNMAKHVMDQLVANGKVTRGYLGIILQQIDNDLADSFDLKKAEGALIAEVLKDSPADKAGLKQGDIVLKYNNIPVESIGALRNFIALQKPGTLITLNILRNQKPIEVNIEIGLLKDDEQQKDLSVKEENQLGLEVQTLTPELAESLNISETNGVLVTQVQQGSPASYVGIKKGAIILAVNNQKVTSKKEYDKLISTTPSNKPILLLIKQGEYVRYVSIRIQ